MKHWAPSLLTEHFRSQLLCLVTNSRLRTLLNILTQYSGAAPPPVVRRTHPIMHLGAKNGLGKFRPASKRRADRKDLYMSWQGLV